MNNRIATNVIAVALVLSSVFLCTVAVALGRLVVPALMTVGCIEGDSDLAYAKDPNKASLFRGALMQANQIDRDGGMQLHLLNSLGECEMRARHFAKARDLFGSALKAAAKSGEAKPAEIARANDGMATALVAQSKYDEAAQYCRRSISQYHEAFGYESRQVARAIGLQGDIYYKMGQLELARRSYDRALRIFNEIDTRPRSVESACAMRALGRCLIALQRDQEARDLMRQSFQILQTNHAKHKRFSPIDGEFAGKRKPRGKVSV